MPFDFSIKQSSVFPMAEMCSELSGLMGRYGDVTKVENLLKRFTDEIQTDQSLVIEFFSISPQASELLSVFKEVLDACGTSVLTLPVLRAISTILWLPLKSETTNTAIEGACDKLALSIAREYGHLLHHVMEGPQPNFTRCSAYFYLTRAILHYPGACQLLVARMSLSAPGIIDSLKSHSRDPHSVRCQGVSFVSDLISRAPVLVLRQAGFALMWKMLCLKLTRDDAVVLDDFLVALLGLIQADVPYSLRSKVATPQLCAALFEIAGFQSELQRESSVQALTTVLSSTWLLPEQFRALAPQVLSSASASSVHQRRVLISLIECNPAVSQYVSTSAQALMATPSPDLVEFIGLTARGWPESFSDQALRLVLVDGSKEMKLAGLAALARIAATGARCRPLPALQRITGDDISILAALCHALRAFKEAGNDTRLTVALPPLEELVKLPPAQIADIFYVQSAKKTSLTAILEATAVCRGGPMIPVLAQALGGFSCYQPLTEVAVRIEVSLIYGYMILASGGAKSVEDVLARVRGAAEDVSRYVLAASANPAVLDLLASVSSTPGPAPLPFCVPATAALTSCLVKQVDSPFVRMLCSALPLALPESATAKPPRFAELVRLAQLLPPSEMATALTCREPTPHLRALLKLSLPMSQYLRAKSATMSTQVEELAAQEQETPLDSVPLSWVLPDIRQDESFAAYEVALAAVLAGSSRPLSELALPALPDSPLVLADGSQADLTEALRRSLGHHKTALGEVTAVRLAALIGGPHRVCGLISLPFRDFERSECVTACLRTSVLKPFDMSILRRTPASGTTGHGTPLASLLWVVLHRDEDYGVRQIMTSDDAQLIVHAGLSPCPLVRAMASDIRSYAISEADVCPGYHALNPKLLELEVTSELQARVVGEALSSFNVTSPMRESFQKLFKYNRLDGALSVQKLYQGQFRNNLASMRLIPKLFQTQTTAGVADLISARLPETLLEIAMGPFDTQIRTEAVTALVAPCVIDDVAAALCAEYRGMALLDQLGPVAVPTDDVVNAVSRFWSHATATSSRGWSVSGGGRLEPADGSF